MHHIYILIKYNFIAIIIESIYREERKSSNHILITFRAQYIFDMIDENIMRSRKLYNMKQYTAEQYTCIFQNIIYSYHESLECEILILPKRKKLPIRIELITYRLCIYNFGYT